MPRLPKRRKIRVFPDYYSFIPENSEEQEMETIILTLDEYETVKLLDAEGMNQTECANSMGVARTTVTAMYESARKIMTTGSAGGLLCGYKPLLLATPKGALKNPPAALRLLAGSQEPLFICPCLPADP